MMILTDAYSQNIYSSRKIETACKRDIKFMWLLVGQKAPDHSTIARFRTGFLADACENLFYQMVRRLEDAGELSKEIVFIDGIKLETCANKYASKVQNPEKTVGVFMGWSRNFTAGNNKDDYIPMAPLKGSSGEQVWRTVDADVMSRGAFAITKQAEKPEILMRWIDQSYEPETSLEIGQGLLGRALEKTEDGGYRQMKPQEGMLLDTMIHDYSPGNSGVFAITQTMIDKLELNENLQERKELDEFYAPYNVPLENMYPNVFFTEEEIEEIGVLQTDIDAYVMKMYAQWIVEGGVDDWDGFQKQLEKMNVGRYIELYQKAYDRYVKAE